MLHDFCASGWRLWMWEQLTECARMCGSGIGREGKCSHYKMTPLSTLGMCHANRASILKEPVATWTACIALLLLSSASDALSRYYGCGSYCRRHCIEFWQGHWIVGLEWWHAMLRKAVKQWQILDSLLRPILLVKIWRYTNLAKANKQRNSEALKHMYFGQHSIAYSYGTGQSQSRDRR